MNAGAGVKMSLFVLAILLAGLLLLLLLLVCFCLRCSLRFAAVLRILLVLLRLFTTAPPDCCFLLLFARPFIPLPCCNRFPPSSSNSPAACFKCFFVAVRQSCFH